jgi:hypothetical protein
MVKALLNPFGKKNRRGGKSRKPQLCTFLLHLFMQNTVITAAFESLSLFIVLLFLRSQYGEMALAIALLLLTHIVGVGQFIWVPLAETVNPTSTLVILKKEEPRL